MKRLLTTGVAVGILFSGGEAQPAVGKNCVVLIATPSTNARIELIADAVVQLRNQAHLGRDLLPVAVLNSSESTHQPAISGLGFKPADLPLATTGQIDAGGLPITANLHRPPISLTPKIIAYYLLAEWARREKNPPKLPEFAYPASPAEGLAQKPSLNPNDGSEMVQVPGGKFWRGCCDGELDELPPMLVEVKPFFIGKREVSVAQYARFVESSQYRTQAEVAGYSWCWVEGDWDKVEGANWRNPGGNGQPAPPEAPVTQVTRADAEAYCNWAKARLPRENEWEKAARGLVGRRYPWGEKWMNGSRATAASPYGCLGMGGGVREWTETPFAIYHPDIVLKEPRAGRVVVRGGAETDGPRECRTTYRFTAIADSRSDKMGFRIVTDGSTRLGLSSY